MPGSPRTNSESRPLLVNGEALRVDVERANGGGGDKFEPQSVDEARQKLSPQIETTVDAVTQIPARLRAGKRVYIEAELLPNYMAASDFPAELLTHFGATLVGSRSALGLYKTRTREETVRTRRLILSVEDEGLRELRRLVTDGDRNRSEKQALDQIREFEEISLPHQEDVLRTYREIPDEEKNDSPAVWEAVLHPQSSQNGSPRPVDEETLEKWFDLIEELGGEIYRDYIREVEGLTFTPVRLSAETAREATQFNPLRVIRPMSAIRPRPSFGNRSLQPLASPSTNRPLFNGVSVAVFDGGINTSENKGLFDIPYTELTPSDPTPDDLHHGTGVTGAVLYGLVGPGEQARTPPLPVESYRVLPAPNIPHDLEGYWVLDQIKKVVLDKKHKIVNLSLGPAISVEEEAEPNRWTSELDQLAWEQDVLFVVAAGNNGEEMMEYGFHRVQAPGDMANGLAVGACDAPFPEKSWSHAPYSAQGPGRHGARVQPLGVQFGGTSENLFNVLRADGNFLQAAGTSFAAPLTTHALSDLVTRLPRVNSSVLRAFAAHFAERPRAHLKLQNQVGYGRQPLTYGDLLECSPNEVHVLYVDTIARGDLLGYQVPIPSQSEDDLELKVTLAYASPTDPREPTEYTRASLEPKFRPHERMHSFTSPPGMTNETKIVDLNTDEARELLSLGWKMSQEPITKTLGSSSGTKVPEVKLRDGGKWETVRHYRLNLPAEAVENPRLELSYVARRSGPLDNSPTEVPFAILMSVTSKNPNADIYSFARAQFTKLRPAQRVGSRLQTRSDSTSHWH